MRPLRARIALAATTLALLPTLAACGLTGGTQSDGTAGAPVVTFPADGGPASSLPDDTVPAGKVRAPDATGTIETLAVSDGSGSAIAASIGFGPDAGFEYFEGTTFDVPPSAFPHGEDGVTLAPSDLSVGARINVWVGACRESFPVQCDVERVELAP